MFFKIISTTSNAMQKLATLAKNIVAHANSITSSELIYNGTGSIMLMQENFFTLYIRPIFNEGQTNFDPNDTNLTEENVLAILNKMNETGWNLRAVRIVTGTDIDETAVKQLFETSFLGEGYDDLSSVLDEEDFSIIRLNLGNEASGYRFIHAEKLLEKGFSRTELATLWKDNVTNNKVKQINTSNISKSKVGKLKGCIIDDTALLERIGENKPIILINGYVHQLMEGFLRKNQKIPFFIFESDKDKSYDDAHLIGNTDPNLAFSDSLRGQLVNNNNTTHSLSIKAPPTVLNNVLSARGPGERALEIVKNFFPGLVPTSSEASSIAPEVWMKWTEGVEKYCLGAPFKRNAVISAVTTETVNAGLVPNVTTMSNIAAMNFNNYTPNISIVGTGSGSGSRLMPGMEEKASKCVYPLAKDKHPAINPLLIKLFYFSDSLSYFPIHGLHLLTSSKHNLIERILDRLMGVSNLATLLRVTSTLNPSLIPRMEPYYNDLIRSEAFKQYCENRGLIVSNEAKRISTDSFKIKTINGEASFQPPGHIHALTDYILHKMQEDISNKVNVVYINSLEEIGNRLNMPLIKFVYHGDKALYFSFIENTVNSGGGLALVDGKPSILRKSWRPDLPMSYKHTCQCLLNINNLLKHMKVSKEEFLLLTKDEIRKLITEHILKGLVPDLEVKNPVDDHWVLQFHLGIDDLLGSNLPTGVIIKDGEYRHEFAELKTKEDLKNIELTRKRYYSETETAIRRIIGSRLNDLLNFVNEVP